MTGMLAGIDVGTTNPEVDTHTVDGIHVVGRRPTPAEAGWTSPSNPRCLLAVAGIRVTPMHEHSTDTTCRGPLPVGTPALVAGHDHLVAAHTAGAGEPGDVVDSLGTAEAVVTVSERVAPRAAAGSGMSWNRKADGARRAMMSGFPHRGRLPEHAHVQPRDVTVLPAPVASSDVLPGDDNFANRHDLIYRDGFCPGYGRWHD